MPHSGSSAGEMDFLAATLSNRGRKASSSVKTNTPGAAVVDLTAKLIQRNTGA
jgi:hypothetical protein